MIFLAWRLLMPLCSLVAASADNCLLCTESTFFSTAFEMGKCRWKKRGRSYKSVAFCFFGAQPIATWPKNSGSRLLPKRPRSFSVVKKFSWSFSVVKKFSWSFSVVKKYYNIYLFLRLFGAASILELSKIISKTSQKALLVRLLHAVWFYKKRSYKKR